VNQLGETTPLDSDGSLHLQNGDRVKIAVDGLTPRSAVDVWLFSTPTKLGTANVQDNGKVVATFTLPSKIESGSHRLALVAKLPNGKSANIALGIRIGDVEQTSTLTRFIIAIPIAISVMAGLALPNQVRRRKRRSALT